MESKSILEFFNHQICFFIRVGFGLGCGIFSPVLLSGGWPDVVEFNTKFFNWIILGALFTICVYAIGYHLRDTKYVKGERQRPWMLEAMGHAINVGCSVYLVVHPPKSIAAFSCLAMSALGFQELVRPISDFGMVQGFVKLPLLIAVADHGFILVPVIIVIYGVVVLPWVMSYTPPHGLPSSIIAVSQSENTALAPTPACPPIYSRASSLGSATSRLQDPKAAGAAEDTPMATGAAQDPLAAAQGDDIPE